MKGAAAKAGGLFKGKPVAKVVGHLLSARDELDAIINLESDPDYLSAGLYGYGGLKALNASAPRLLGKQRIYHGTSKANAERIAQEGLDPVMGGKAGASAHVGKDRYVKNSTGHIHVTPLKRVAAGFSHLYGSGAGKGDPRQMVHMLKGMIMGTEGPGKIVRGHLDYGDFKDNFHIDPDMPGGMAYRTTQKIGPEKLGRMSVFKDLKLAKYAKAHPGRLASGAGLAALGGAGIAGAVSSLAKKKTTEKTAEMSAREELNLILFAKQQMATEHEPPAITGKNMAKLIAGGAAFTGGGMALQALIAKLKSMRTRNLSAREELNLIRFGIKEKISKIPMWAVGATGVAGAGIGLAHWARKTRKRNYEGQRKIENQTVLDEATKDQLRKQGYGHLLSAKTQLNTIFLGSDPRPRNRLGEFGSDEPGGPDPRAMSLTYGQAAGVGAAGVAAGAGGSLALKSLIEKMRKNKGVKLGACDDLSTMLFGDKWRNDISDNAGAVATASGLVGGLSSYVRGGVESSANWKSAGRIKGSLAGGAVAGLGGYAIAKLLKKTAPSQGRMVQRIGDGHQNSI